MKWNANQVNICLFIYVHRYRCRVQNREVGTCISEVKRVRIQLLILKLKLPTPTELGLKKGVRFSQAMNSSLNTLWKKMLTFNVSTKITFSKR